MNSNKKWQFELRRKLEHEAFNEKYKCFICGKKENLHIHHLIYTNDKEGFFNPKYWRILCANCHAKTPRKKRNSKIIKGSKIISFCDYCGKKMKFFYKRKYCDYCLLVHYYNWSHEEYIKLYKNSEYLNIRELKEES